MAGGDPRGRIRLKVTAGCRPVRLPADERASTLKTTTNGSRLISSRINTCYCAHVTHASEVLWSDASHICTLGRDDDRYELLLHRDGRLVCLLTVESEDAARTLAHQWRLKRDSTRLS